MNPLLGTLHIIIDSSGSMKEMSKLLLAHNLVAFIREFSEFHPEKISLSKTQMFTWSDTIQPIELNSNCEIPQFQASGKADLTKIKDLLESEIEKKTQAKAIILSDGNFSRVELKKFSSWSKEIPHITLRTVAVGPDAIFSNLKELSTNNCVFNSEDIAAAIQSLIAGIDEKIQRPVSINNFFIPSDQENNDEGWD
ncbi:MAG: hypothetical protein ACI86H_001912 [bacterium]|jgi:hypothetical protein